MENNAQSQGFIEFIVPAPEIYFIIYKSNANLLGKIKNDKLRTLIVSVYLHINEMCNSFNSYTNTKMKLLSTNIAPEQQEFYLKQLESSYLKKMKNSHDVLKKEWEEFKKLVESNGDFSRSNPLL